MINEDETVVFNLLDERVVGTWKTVKAVAEITFDEGGEEEVFQAKRVGEELVLDLDGELLFFESSDNRSAAPAPSSSEPKETITEKLEPKETKPIPTDPGEPSSVEDVFSGESYEWPDGMVVTIGDLEIFDLDSDLAGYTPIKFTVNVYNGTSASFDPTNIVVDVFSAGEFAPIVTYAAEAGIHEPYIVIGPGETLIYMVGFLIPDTNDIQMTWSTDLDRYPVFYTN